jgi:hypothetical protein
MTWRRRMPVLGAALSSATAVLVLMSSEGYPNQAIAAAATSGLVLGATLGLVIAWANGAFVRIGAIAAALAAPFGVWFAFSASGNSVFSGNGRNGLDAVRFCRAQQHLRAYALHRSRARIAPASRSERAARCAWSSSTAKAGKSARSNAASP